MTYAARAYNIIIYSQYSDDIPQQRVFRNAGVPIATYNTRILTPNPGLDSLRKL